MPAAGSIRRLVRPDRDGHTAPVRVLIVDGNDDCRESLTTLLGVEGALVQCCATARDALRLIEKALPSVVISDTRLPEVDGYQLMRMIRVHRCAAVAHLPAIALTAAATVNERIKTLAAGFTTHLTRPVDAEELIAAIASLSGLATLDRAASVDAPINLRDYEPTIYELPAPEPDGVGSLRGPLVSIREWLTSLDVKIGSALTVEARAQIAQLAGGIVTLIELLAPATRNGDVPPRTPLV